MPGAHLILLAVALGAFADETPATTRVHPFANMNGFTTERVIANPTSVDIVVRRPCPDGQSQCPEIKDLYPAFSIKRINDWPRYGANVEKVTLDARLVSWTKIRAPLGPVERFDRPLPALQGAEYYDLPQNEEFESLIFIAVSAGADGWYQLNGETTRINSESAHLVRAPADRVKLELGNKRVGPPLPGPPEVYTFAIVVHRATGAITAVYPVN